MAPSQVGIEHHSSTSHLISLSLFFSPRIKGVFVFAWFVRVIVGAGHRGFFSSDYLRLDPFKFCVLKILI